ncbi:hypothetical protein AJ80_05150 [Polytolypa hystricis UAMH7299]|uniref:DOMON domain-containing protein n=1 Tax=Polytolypa hystricis (strain UAMH7299) TaxID=1447883 RepID=A0A2B7Y6X7_POLH7|nr:hypothetical protein AJ80_05150 [Polytolypa hystricis UAMH7299]
MRLPFAAAAAVLWASVPLALCQTVQFAPGNQAADVSYRVHIPARTASSGSGSIYMQLQAPSSIEWVALGQGTGMEGSNIFIVYAASASNITLSPRLGGGPSEPKYNPNARVSLIEGSGISNGKMTANILCANCLSWQGGSMDPKSERSPWIWAVKSGSPLNSRDPQESLQIHDARGTLVFDLTKATGQVSGNPFSGPQPNNDPDEDSGSSAAGGVTAETILNKRTAHAIVMAVTFVILFPAFALAIHILPYSKKVPRIHAPLQAFTLLLAIGGTAVGISLATDMGGSKVTQYHPIIGYVVMGVLILLQPALGLVHHIRYRRTGQRTPMGLVHRWLGRAALAAGIANGGIGFHFSGIGQGAPTSAAYVYAAMAGIMGLFYLLVLVVSARKNKQNSPESVSELKNYYRSER